MSKIVAITSSKGGVGKSTIANHLARTMASAGEKTVIVETDVGLRGLDILLNMPNIIYDIYDVLNNNCKIENAIQIDTHNKNLALLPAPLNFNYKLNFKQFKHILKILKHDYKNIVIDLNCNYQLNAQLIEIVNLMLIITTPDPICVRDIALFVNYLNKYKIDLKNTRLIINKLQKNLVRKNIFKNIDEIIDETTLQLIGVIPQNKKLEIANFCGKNLDQHCNLKKIFSAIYQRINKNNKKLLI